MSSVPFCQPGPKKTDPAETRIRSVNFGCADGTRWHAGPLGSRLRHDFQLTITKKNIKKANEPDIIALPRSGYPAIKITTTTIAPSESNILLIKRTKLLPSRSHNDEE